MAKTSTVAFGTCALLALAVSARAQDPDPPSRFLNPREVAPYVTSGGDTTGIGATVRWPMTSRLSIQAEGEYRNARRDPIRFQPSSSGINGNLVLVLDLPRFWRVTPFVVGGGGVEHHIDLASTPASGGPLWHGGNSFVVNGGGGFRFALSDRVGARVEIRYADGWAQGAWDSVRFMYGTTVGFGQR
jgi:opacity protein-like surface antigen